MPDISFSAPSANAELPPCCLHFPYTFLPQLNRISNSFSLFPFSLHSLLRDLLYNMVSENDQLKGRLSHRALKQLVTDSPVPKEVVKPILCIWDHEKSFSDQLPGVLDEVKKLLGLDNMPWPSEVERAVLLSAKVDRIFRQLLYNHGSVLSPRFQPAISVQTD